MGKFCISYASMAQVGENKMRLAMAETSAILGQRAQAASLLRIMGNDRRLTVLCALAQSGERSVGELETISGLSQSALSQHLAKMRQHGIVKTRRSAQSIFYSIASSEVIQVLRLLADLYQEREAVFAEAG